MRWAAVIGAALCAAQLAGAQSSPSSCLDSLAASTLPRNIMTLVSQQKDSVSPQGQVAQSAIDLYAQSVAQQMRRLVGKSDSVLAGGEPAVTWVSGGAVRVVARRGGPIESAVIAANERSVGLEDSKIGALIAAAVDSLNSAREGFAWTNDLIADSLAFELHVVGFLDEGTPPMQRDIRLGFPVFTLAMPTLEPVRGVPSSLGPRYPTTMRELRQEGHVVARFIVDANGRFRAGSFRDVTAESMHLPQGIFGPSHEEFVSAVRQALPRMIFQPARLGRCHVAQLVQQPFDFNLSDDVTTVAPPGTRRP